MMKIILTRCFRAVRSFLAVESNTCNSALLPFYHVYASLQTQC